jgi:hypothetical protein
MALHFPIIHSRAFLGYLTTLEDSQCWMDNAISWEFLHRGNP